MDMVMEGGVLELFISMLMDVGLGVVFERCLLNIYLGGDWVIVLLNR